MVESNDNPNCPPEYDRICTPTAELTTATRVGSYQKEQLVSILNHKRKLEVKKPGKWVSFSNSWKKQMSPSVDGSPIGDKHRGIALKSLQRRQQTPVQVDQVLEIEDTQILPQSKPNKILDLDRIRKNYGLYVVDKQQSKLISSK